MNTARIIVLVVALGPGGIAAHLADSCQDNAAPTAQVTEQLATVEILVAKSDINLGVTLKLEDLQWQIWSASSASAGARQSGTPELALRSAVDANASDGSNEDQAIRGPGALTESDTACLHAADVAEVMG
jgi:Flp pilus assembly protein CpaB